MESNLGISKSKKNPNFVRKSGFVTSHRSVEILQFIRENESKMSKQDMYQKIKKMDNNVPGYSQFTVFLRGLNTNRQKRVGANRSTFFS